MTRMRVDELRFEVSPRIGSVSALLTVPAGARSLFVVAHGAGAGMRHAFLDSIARGLAERDVATLRYNFPYAEQGRRGPDPPAALTATVRSAVAAGAAAAGALPVFAGGKSMGGRMTSTAAADGELPGVRGLFFLGFPLHPPGKPSIERADHLDRVRLPMLFVQGTRDAFAGLELLRPVTERLADRATLHLIDGADHGFRVPRSSGRTQSDVLHEMTRVLARWAEEG